MVLNAKKKNWFLVIAVYIVTITIFFVPTTFAGGALSGKINNLTWTIPLVAESPRIDGNIGGKEWAGAAGITGFCGTGDYNAGGVYHGGMGASAGGSYLPPLQPVGFLCYDTKAIYMTFRIPRPKGVPLVSNAEKHDGRLWNDDSIELFVSSNDKSYRHFIVNPENTRYDAVGRTNPGWNGSWSSATGHESDFWTIEIAVPWKDLGYTSPPPSLKFNVCWNCKTGAKGSYSWSAVYASYHEPDKFAELILGTERAALRLTSLSLTPAQSPCLKFELVGDTQELMKAKLLSSDEKTVTVCQSEKGKSDLIISPPQEGDAAKAGSYILEYQCGDLANWRMGIQISSPISSIKRMLAGFVDVSIDLSLIGTDAKLAKIDLTLISDKTKKTIMQTQLYVSGKSQFTHTFDINSLPVGNYTVKAVVLDKTAQIIATYYDTTIHKPSRPEWQDFRGGITDKVLPPWTPVEIVEKNKVQVWGRKYQMANGIFPDKIITRNKDILSAPIRFKGACNGVPFKWKEQAGRLVKHSSDKASFEGSMSSGDIQIKGTSVIEYDGMIKVDFDVIPSGKKSNVGLVLEIPLKKLNAKYLYYFPGIPGSTANAGAIPIAGWTSPFKPYVWLGDNDCGLAWFCESMEGWRPANPDRALSIIRRGEDVVLRLDILSNVSLDQPRHFTFGLQATPVKSPPKDAWDYRITRVFGQDKDRLHQKDSKHIKHLASLGVRTIVYHENWTDIQCSHIPFDPQGLRNLVEACHKNNMQILLYFGSEMSDIHPDWDFSNIECIQISHDKHVVPWGGPATYKRKNPKQNCVRVCYTSLWNNYLAWAVAKCMDEYDIDGVYLDGTAFPFPCGSESHGCGYVGDDGKRHDAYNILAVRNLLKRLYTIVKTRKPDGQINVHNSGNMVTPTIGWATSTWDGEQLRVDFRKIGFRKALKLDTFRAEFMGRQWGIPSEFLAYVSYAPTNARDALAFTLIHDIIVRLDRDPVLASRLWNAMDTFGRKQAEWLPYWDNSQYVTTTSEDAKVSIYNRKEKGALLVVSNLAETEQNVTVVPNMKTLGVGAGPFSATDMMSGKPVEVLADGKISLKMKYMEWRLIKLENRK